MPAEPDRPSRLDRSLSISAIIIALLSLGIGGAQAYPSIKAYFFPAPTCDAHQGLMPKPVDSATATSTLGPQGSYTYEPDNAFDGDAKTAWIPKGGNGGVGQQIVLRFRSPVDVELACVINGYALSSDIYTRNARVRDVTVETQAGTVTGTLANMSPTQFDMYQRLPLRAGRTDYVKITINTFYSGISENGRRGYLDTALSEVTLYGR